MRVELILGCWGREKDNFSSCSGTKNVILDITKNTEKNVLIAEFLDKVYGLFDKPLYSNVHTALWSLQDKFSEIGKPIFPVNLFKQIEEFCILHKKCGVYLRLNVQDQDSELGEGMGNNVVILDIDGTICDSNQRVKDMCEKAGYEFSWDNVDKVFSSVDVNEFFNPDEVAKDKVIEGSEKILCLVDKLKADLYLVTGRNDNFRKITLDWLIDKFGIKKETPLFMRTEEFQKTNLDIYKEITFVNHILSKHEGSTFWFFDDDDRVLLKYSKYGVSFKAPDCWRSISC